MACYVYAKYLSFRTAALECEYNCLKLLLVHIYKYSMSVKQSRCKNNVDIISNKRNTLVN